MSDNDDIVKEFLAESSENLDRLDREVVELEKHPSDRETLASIFRTIHTIKGTSGFLGFGKLEAVAHVGESLLARLRDGQLVLTPERTTGLLAMVDAVRQMLGSIEQSGNEGERDDHKLINTLVTLLQPSAEGAVPGKPAGPSEAEKPATPPEVQGQPAPATASIEQAPDTKASSAPAEASSNSPGSKGVEDRGVPGEPVPESRETKPQPVAEAPRASQEHAQPEVSQNTVRVNVALLDQLMNLVGELVLARNQILQFTRTTEETSLVTTGQRLNLIATELQENVMKTRMQPIGSIWGRFPRTVRDVAVACGKRVRIQMEGQETELDRTLIEAIKDPMTHLVRNSVDHGIESAEARVAAGKDPEGLLLLRAYHEGGQVNVEISDDGAGLNLKKVIDKAIKKGLITPEQAARLSDREAANLIFLPGLSTAEKVTNVSGRGVGMDVVKTNIERIGGTVDLQSVLGKGTTVKLKIPLTLAIVPALIVTSGGQRFAIPQVSLLELVGLDGDDAHAKIESIHGVPVYRLRGNLLPLVYLNRELGAAARAEAVLEGAPAAKSASVDFEQARRAHQQWLSRLRDVLADKVTMTADQVVSHTSCDLGRWLYSTALATYSNVGEVYALETAHKHFHELGAKVIALKASGQADLAQRELKNVESASHRILELLNTVEQRIVNLRTLNIVVLQADQQQFGLVVDEISDTEEIVVKPLGKHLKHVSVFAGATIMGDGKVALILDVFGLAQRAHVIDENRERSASEAEARQSAETAHHQHAVLLFRHGETGTMAIDLASVARLEEFPPGSLEPAGDSETVQYRGQIMPLIRLSEVLPGRPGARSSESSGSLQVVVVYAENGRNVGLVVDHILDIVDEAYSLDRQTARPGIVGSAVLQKRVTDLVDVAGVLASHGIQAAKAAGA